MTGLTWTVEQAVASGSTEPGRAPTLQPFATLTVASSFEDSTLKVELDKRYQCCLKQLHYDTVSVIANMC